MGRGEGGGEGEEETSPHVHVHVHAYLTCLLTRHVFLRETPLVGAARTATFEVSSSVGVGDEVSVCVWEGCTGACVLACLRACLRACAGG